MTLAAWEAAAALAMAVALAVPAGAAAVRPRRAPVAARQPDDWVRRWRLLWCALAAVGGLVVVGGGAGIAAAPVAAVATWVVVERAEPAQLRRDREQAQRDLPHLVGLLADALTAGRAPEEALTIVAAALPGPAAETLTRLLPRLRLGADPLQVWSDLAADPALAPLGRALARAHRTGAPVVPVVERLAEELARASRAEVEDRARRVGVQAALPLGLCLLPAFVLLGIVPVVAGLLTGLGL